MEKLNLERLLTEEVRCATEIKRRIEIAKNAFCNMRNLFTNRKVSIKAIQSKKSPVVNNNMAWKVEPCQQR